MDGSLEMRDVCQRAIEALKSAGAITGELACPQVFHDLTEAQKVVMAYDVARARIFEYSHHAQDISAQFIELFEAGLAVSRDEFEAACATRARASHILESMFLETDVILTPAAPGEAPPGLGATGDPLFSRGWNLLQVPCVSIPFGNGPNGLPLSVQLVGRMNADDELLAVSKWVTDVLNNA